MPSQMTKLVDFHERNGRLVPHTVTDVKYSPSKDSTAAGD